MASYSQQQIYNAIRRYGGTPHEARELSAAAMAESGGNSGSANTSGENSRGVFQINLQAHTPKFQALGVDPTTGAHDLDTSAQVALQIFRQSGIQPWSVSHEQWRGTDRDYRQYLGADLREEGTGNQIGNIFGGVDAGEPAPPPKNVTPVGDPNNPLGYEVTYSDGSFDVLTPEEYHNLQTYGDPAGPDKPDAGSVHHPAPYGFAAPDPGSAVTAIFQKYEYELLQAQLPREQAKENFEQRWRLFEAAQAGEISYGQFLQNAAITEAELTSARDNQLIEIAKAQQTDERERSLARTNRDLEIGNIRQRAGTDWLVHGAPKALPSNVTGIQLPILGNIGTTQYNPDDVMGIPYLNSIRDVPDSGITFPTPSAVPQIPVPPVSKPPAELGVPFPTFNVPNIPDISGLIAQLTGGSPPMGFA